ncbi:hypothetical protein HNP12_000191 [Aeromonas hydrophila]|uniref:DUF1353 domain-containing protein n=1 Tax=Aeromonas hydrophila TaxID=644 RepID=UPI0021691223|nr:DUF1353 domain-containing protein [Aeromonas hydrophila]MCS3766152.1 hypothetical protein [Aeromonas hydrophila]
MTNTTNTTKFIQPVLVPVDDLNWELHEDYYVKTSKVSFIIPAGFITDLASVPKIVWNLYPPFGLYTGAAVAHDYLYRNPKMRMTREEADSVFLEVMHQANVRKAKAQLMFVAVRAFGGSSFKDRR